MKKKLTVLIAGPMPPPAGGISIHLQRLAHLMEGDVHCDFIDEASVVKKEYFHVKQLNPFTYFKKIRQCDIFFIHSGNRLLKKIHILAGRLMGRRVIITIHGYGNRRAFPYRQIDSFFFRMAHRIILVNEGIYEKLPLPKERCVVKHAFLPPVLNTEPALPDMLSSCIRKARNNGQWVLCANASALTMHNGHELYGLDMCIELSRQLMETGVPTCFIFVLTTTGGPSAHLLATYQQRIREQGLEDQFHLICDNLSFVRLIDASDMVIRPTNADGDALTVREALFMNRAVVVSDVVSRPEGAVLFRTRNQDDLLKKTLQTMKELGMPGHHHTTVQTETPELFRQFYKDLFTGVAAL